MKRFCTKGGEEPLFQVNISYSLLIYVDTSIVSGDGLGVSSEGPGIFFYPTEEKALAFARQLLAEVDVAG